MSVLLNGRTHFSVGESLLSTEELVDEAAKIGATALAVCDTMRISSLPELFSKCKEKNIKPIIGARVRIVDELQHEKGLKKKVKSYYLRILVFNETGYRGLLKLLSKAFDKEHFFFEPRLTLNDITECFKTTTGVSNVMVTLGDFYGAHAAGKAEEVVSTLDKFGLSVVSEIVPVCLPHFVRTARSAIEMWHTKGIPIIISSPTLYKDSSHAETFDIIRVMTEPGERTMESWSARHQYRDYIVKDVKDQLAVFANELSRFYGNDPANYLAELISFYEYNQKVADSCTFVWEKEPPSLPKMAPDEYKALVSACMVGWKKRFSKPIYGHQPTNLKPYQERLRYELEVLKNLKFEGYFLLIAEIVNFARSNNIAVGPGRGSAAGSLVAYLMGITDIDPIRFNLLFERFINPSRIDLPDADLDFMSNRREEIITWIRNRFGEEHVAYVSNYMQFKPAICLTGLCRVLNVNDSPIFGPLIPKDHGQSYTLEQALESVPDLVKFSKENPEIIKHAEIIEDRISNYSKHASGIIVAQAPLHERAVVETREGEPVINWDKRIAEDFGLVKVDVLGVSNLDMIEIALGLIKKTHGITIDLHDIPLNDKPTLEAFGKGLTTGVFQFGSYGIRNLLKSLALNNDLTFDDISAATALYRPGPMDSGMMQQFVDIKQGKIPITFAHPSMEKGLNDTYGVMLYQENVMRVCQDFAGFTLVEADNVRKAMGKKDKVKMAKWELSFVEGAVKTHGVKEDFAQNIWNQISKFASYGFNKSHAVSYGLISYQCMYLKVNYPIEYFAGVMSMVDGKKYPSIIADMKRHGIKLIPPDINISSDTFEPLNANSLSAPISAVLGVGIKTTSAIVKEREANGPFASTADFKSRIRGRDCNKIHFEKLNKVGAFARLDLTQLPIDHPDRKRDQVELMGGLVDGGVFIDQPLNITATSISDLSTLIDEYKVCDKCELAGLCHPKPYIKSRAKFMVVLDGPSTKDEAADELGNGSGTNALAEACYYAGIELSDTYITSLIKTVKPEGEKDWSVKTTNECPVWIEKEIEILKPTVILLLGTKAARYFIKGGVEGGLVEHCGRIIFDKERNINFVLGLNTGQIYFHPEYQEKLNEAVALIPDLIPDLIPV